MVRDILLNNLKLCFICLVVLLSTAVLSGRGECETYGVQDLQGNFVPKITVTVGSKEILIKKVDPEARFKTISFTLNGRNVNLVRNVGHLNIQWTNQLGNAGRKMIFAGPRYNSDTRVFQDSMTKSKSVKIIDASARDLFGDKELADILTIHIDGKPCISSESFYEKKNTVRMGPGKDLSINLDKTSILFDKNNYKKGEIINVDNRSGFNQTLGVDLPDKGLLYYQIIKKPEQTKVPRENWDRFTVEADSGVFIVVIPEPDPLQLAELDGSDITIKVWDGAQVRETKKIPVRTSEELRNSEDLFKNRRTRKEEFQPDPPKADPPPISDTGSPQDTPVDRRVNDASPSPGGSSGGLFLWGAVALTIVLLIITGSYVVFFMLPRIQVLEDRLAKNEMFIHGSRDAIREELEEIKEDIIRQCLAEPNSD